MRSILLFVIALIIPLFINTSQTDKAIPNNDIADLILVNGKVVTMDDSGSILEAVVVKNGVIIFTGTTSEAKKYSGDGTKVIDLEGRLLIPGFIESHGHFYGTGRSLNILDLVGTSSPEEIAELVRKKAAQLPEGKWISGRGWDQNDWKEKEFPTTVLLDNAAPKNPVILNRVDGHAVWVNKAALTLAGITDETADPAGGEILRDESGHPTGILVDNAINFINKVLPYQDENEIIDYLITAERHCFKFGVTSFHDMGISQEILSIVKKLYADGRLKIRLYEMLESGLPGWENEAKLGPQVNLFNGHLTIRGVKAYIDGALGSRGALLLEPYSDRQDTSGLQVTKDEELNRIAEQCKKYGLQFAVHAIGDLGNRKVLDIYEKIIGKDEKGERRWRIEHAQIVDPVDIPRFGNLGVIPSMQPVHCTSDMPWAPVRLGEKRLAGAYAWRSLLNAGSIIPGGSDTPVEHTNPLLGIYAAITRQDIIGYPPSGWQPEQRLKIYEALKMFTVWGAWTAFEEGYKGAVKPGYVADLIVLDRDILQISSSEIPGTKVVMTFLAGELVYSNLSN